MEEQQQAVAAKESQALMTEHKQQSSVNGYSQETLDNAVGTLARFGGFNFLESAIDGVQNLNPERKARKKIFLTDESKGQERKNLKNRIDLWLSILSSGKSVSEMLNDCQT